MLNSVNIIGNLTRDPEIKYTSSGKSVCNLSIANNRTYTSNGQKTTEVSYFDVEVWGVIAENCAKYLAKGRGVAVEGRLKQDRWEKDGKTQSRVRIVASSVHFMPQAAKREDVGGGYGGGQGASVQPSTPEESLEPQPSSESTAWDE